MKNREKTIQIVLVGVFAAVLAVLSQISIPLPSGIPVTLQTFAVVLCGYALGWKRGLLATAVYVALGLVGLPVFSGFSGGVGSVLGMAGGYIWGFLPMAALCGAGLKAKHRPAALLFGVLGLAACHLFGTVQFAVVSGMGPLESFLVASAPYLIKDAVSVAAAYGIAAALQHALRKNGLDLAA